MQAKTALLVAVAFSENLVRVAIVCVLIWMLYSYHIEMVILLFVIVKFAI